MKKIRFSVLVVAVMGALTVAACGVDVESGTVTGKHYVPPWTSYEYQCYGYNSSGVCTFSMIVPIEYPECWQLNLADTDNNTGEICVYDFEYKQYSVGDQYPHPDPASASTQATP